MREKEIAIRVENLTIRYKSLKAYSIKKNFLKLSHNKREYFEAVKHVSFEVEKGEILGIVGKNGSGKSTMLRALAHIFSPDEGSIDTFGNTVSLLSIGVGFQKELSGRENIILSGMLLGFSEEEIREKMPRIIKFADLGKFIDMPVGTYSSGMYSKLAFSITAILETDIILIDEVLSVGDRRFRKKSYKKMQSLISDEDRTVVIVSHNNQSLRELCTKVLWINDGELMMIGETNEVLDQYEAYMDAEE
jgi:ABC-type polysaccharide/polyol phosphate transport system ATPase subunit